MAKIKKRSRKDHIRSEALDALELTKGFTPEQRGMMGNLLTTMEELAGYIIELTQKKK